MVNINNPSPLLFFGRGAAFADEHNSAFFETDDELILIDCSATAFRKIKSLDLKKYSEISVTVTHSHCDHVSGIPLLVEYMHFVVGKKLNIIVPCEEIGREIEYVLLNMEACEQEWYTVRNADSVCKDWLVHTVPVMHAPGLKGRCFGYVFEVNGHLVVYTGDTSELDSFMEYIAPGVFLYSEIAVFDSGVHLYYEKIMPYLIECAKKGVKVYLMHLDNEDKIKELIAGTQLQLAPLL